MHRENSNSIGYLAKLCQLAISGIFRSAASTLSKYAPSTSPRLYSDPLQTEYSR